MDGECERAAGWLRREPRLPQAQAVCRRGDGLAVESDRHPAGRRILTPNMDGHVALQHRMVGNYAG